MRKMDEMEMAITLRAVKWAWAYTIIFLFIWAIYDYIKVGSFNSLAFILLISQNIIKISIELYLKRKMSKDEK
jgi:CDP-diglyceride synthetase